MSAPPVDDWDLRAARRKAEQEKAEAELLARQEAQYRAEIEREADAIEAGAKTAPENAVEASQGAGEHSPVVRCRKARRCAQAPGYGARMSRSRSANGRPSARPGGNSRTGRSSGARYGMTPEVTSMLSVRVRWRQRSSGAAGPSRGSMALQGRRSNRLDRDHERARNTRAGRARRSR